MRILATGFAVFVIWSLFSIWLYVDKLQPDSGEINTALAIAVNDTVVADTVAVEPLPQPDELLIYFDFDDATVHHDSLTDKHAGMFKVWLEENPDELLAITGHTCSKGSVEYNYRLGMKRAVSVKEYLETFDLSADKMIVSSMGEEQPLSDESTDDGRAKNRRTVIKIKQ